MVARLASLIKKTPWSQTKNACQHDVYHQAIPATSAANPKGNRVLRRSTEQNSRRDATWKKISATVRRPPQIPAYVHRDERIVGRPRLDWLNLVLRSLQSSWSIRTDLCLDSGRSPSPAREPSPVSAPKIRYRLNVRATLIVTAIGLTTALGLYVLWGYQENRILKIALKQVKEFQKAADQAADQDQKSHYNDLSSRHLTPYLNACPNDPEGLDIEAKLRLEAKDLLGAAKVYEHLIRLEGAPGREREPVNSREKIIERRHRLAEIYIVVSDAYRNSLMAKLEPETVAKQYRYYVAELHAKRSLELDGNDAKAHLLYAMALEGQIVPGQTSRERMASVEIRGDEGNEGWEVSVEDGAILEYENALLLMDKNAFERMEGKVRDEHVRDNIVAAIRLAGLYQKASRKTTDISDQLKKLIDPRFDPKKINSVAIPGETIVGFFKAHAAAKRLADLYQGSPEKHRHRQGGARSSA